MRQARSKRIEARIKPDTLAIVQRAAEMQGSSVSEFMVEAAEGAARKVLDDNYRIELSVDDQRRFVALLVDPPEPSGALRRAAAAHEDLIGPV